MITDAEYARAFQIKEGILKDNRERISKLEALRLELAKQLASNGISREDYIARMNLINMEEREIRIRNFKLVRDWVEVDMQYQGEQNKLKPVKTVEELNKEGAGIDTWRLEL